jgi:serine/threonine protein kinase
MTSTSCPTPENLSAYVLGRLPEAGLRRVARHASGCLRCQEHLEAADEVCDSLLAHLRRPRPEDPAAEEPSLARFLQAVQTLASSHTPVPNALPESVGHYRVRRLLGAGGMGVVYEAEDMRLRRRVAIKVMSPALARFESARRRFLLEARAMAALGDDRVVRVYAVDEMDGRPFFAMELLQGETLADCLRRTGNAPGRPSLPLSEAMRLAAEIAEGLAAAHARGLVHRDVKPANVFLEMGKGEGGRGNKSHSPFPIPHSPFARVKILDFGLVRVLDEGRRLTQLGDVVGTPSYMAPEQAAAKDVDARADLFGLGCILYELVTGSVPFHGETGFETLRAVVQDEVRPAGEINPRLPLAVAELVHALLAKDPAARPAGAAAVAVALRSLRRRPSRRWPMAVALGAAAAALALLAGSLAFHNTRPAGEERASEPLAAAAPAPVPEPSPAPAPRPEPNEGRFAIDPKTLSPDNRVHFVTFLLQEHNPAYSGEISYQLDDDKKSVRRLDLPTDGVTDLSPLRVLTGLRMLTCRGSAPGKGRLADLSPLRGLKLTHLDCRNNRIDDLSPLCDLPLTDLWCDLDLGRDRASLSAVRSLKHVNELSASFVLQLTSPLPLINR